MFIELGQNTVIDTDKITHIQAEFRSGVGHNYYVYRIYLISGNIIPVSEPMYYAIRNFVLHGEVNKNLSIWQKIKIFCSHWLYSLGIKKLPAETFKSNRSDEKQQI